MRLGDSSGEWHRRRFAGFTLIELLVVLAVLAILASLILPNYLGRVGQAREVALKHNLSGLRTVIDQFYRDKGRYPQSLAELVEQRYIRSIPEDPVTQRTNTWVIVPPDGAAQAESSKGKVFDVHSGAAGTSSDGSAYASW